jgi:transposase
MTVISRSVTGWRQPPRGARTGSVAAATGPLVDTAALASWAGVCPGDNKTAGKPKTASTHPGNRWLTAAFGTAALGAIRRKDSYLHALYRRIAVRRGGKRALAAVTHSQLVTVWHVLTTQTRYQDLGGDYFLRRDNPEHRRRRAVDQLQRLGFRLSGPR